MDILDCALACFGFEKGHYQIENFGTGLINDTRLVATSSNRFILQKVNGNVFANPNLIAKNIENIRDYIAKNQIDYFLPQPLSTPDGDTMVCIENGYYRVFPFVENSHSLEVVKTPEQAYEAAMQFGRFTKVLSDMDSKNLNITLPSFHDLSLRYRQFETALAQGNPKRIAESASLIEELKQHSNIETEYRKIINTPEFKLRPTHHDTKIGNVLFGPNNKSICVIDLDTIMPGYFISDVGDMMRTYLCPVSEEEKEFGKIAVRNEMYFAIVNGYKKYMQIELSEMENDYFFYSGKFMIYMQALRFITDHLNNDVYYGAKYPGHNMVRAQNQATLLNRLIEKESILSTSLNLA